MNGESNISLLTFVLHAFSNWKLNLNFKWLVVSFCRNFCKLGLPITLLRLINGIFFWAVQSVPMEILLKQAHKFRYWGRSGSGLICSGRKNWMTTEVYISCSWIYRCVRVIGCILQCIRGCICVVQTYTPVWITFALEP